jgi:hypothetical protein
MITTTTKAVKLTAFNHHLKAIDACAEARTWAKGKTAQQ